MLIVILKFMLTVSHNGNLVIHNNLIYGDQIHLKLELNNVFGIKMFT